MPYINNEYGRSIKKNTTTFKNNNKPIQILGVENIYKATYKAPNVDEEVTAHFILKVTDRGEPNISRYKRVDVTIQPK